MKIFTNKIFDLKKYVPNEKGYIVVEGADICPFKIDKYFWKGRNSELEFKELLELSQDFFGKIELGEKYKQFWIKDRVDGMYIFMNSAQQVEVVLTEDGIECRTNGYHRCYVARKYNLRLLVHLQDWEWNWRELK